MPWILIAVSPVAAVGLFLLWATSPAVRDARARSGRTWSSQRNAGAIPPPSGFASSEPAEAEREGTERAEEPADEPPITVLTYNVGFASGREERFFGTTKYTNYTKGEVGR